MSLSELFRVANSQKSQDVQSRMIWCQVVWNWKVSVPFGHIRSKPNTQLTTTQPTGLQHNRHSHVDSTKNTSQRLQFMTIFYAFLIYFKEQERANPLAQKRSTTISIWRSFCTAISCVACQLFTTLFWQESKPAHFTIEGAVRTEDQFYGCRAKTHSLKLLEGRFDLLCNRRPLIWSESHNFPSSHGDFPTVDLQAQHVNCVATWKLKFRTKRTFWHRLKQSFFIFTDCFEYFWNWKLVLPGVGAVLRILGFGDFRLENLRAPCPLGISYHLLDLKRSQCCYFCTLDL